MLDGLGLVHGSCLPPRKNIGVRTRADNASKRVPEVKARRATTATPRQATAVTRGATSSAGSRARASRASARRPAATGSSRATRRATTRARASPAPARASAGTASSPAARSATIRRIMRANGFRKSRGILPHVAVNRTRNDPPQAPRGRPPGRASTVYPHERPQDDAEMVSVIIPTQAPPSVYFALQFVPSVRGMC
jgi:hypothetical protein